MIGFTETLLDGAKDDPENVDGLSFDHAKDAIRLDKLIREIIQLSKDEETPYETQTIYLDPYFHQIIQSYQPTIEKNS